MNQRMIIKRNIAIFLLAVTHLSISLGNAANPDSSHNVTARNAVFVELGGNAGGIASVDYDRVLSSCHALHIGFSYLSIGDFHLTTVPLVAHYLWSISESPHRIDLGVGPLFVSSSGRRASRYDLFSSGAVMGTAVIAYRYQRDDGGMFLKGGIAPIFTFKKTASILLLSIGYSF